MCSCSTRQEQGSPNHIIEREYDETAISHFVLVTCFLKLLIDFQKKRYFFSALFGELAKSLIWACAYVEFFLCYCYCYCYYYYYYYYCHHQQGCCQYNTAIIPNKADHRKKSYIRAGQN